MKEIDLNNWGRREIYEFFSTVDCPFYSVTIPLDVTRIKELSKKENLSFYHLMLWVCTKAVDSVEAMRMRIRKDKLVIIDQSKTSFTTMKKGSENFIIVTIPWEEDFLDFCNNAKKIIDNQSTLFSNGDSDDEVIYFSCLPWFDFSSLTNERNFDNSDTIPRISWGKYYEENGKLMLHLSIDVNHRTVDGIHIGKFKTAFDDICNSI